MAEQITIRVLLTHTCSFNFKFFEAYYVFNCHEIFVNTMYVSFNSNSSVTAFEISYGYNTYLFSVLD